MPHAVTEAVATEAWHLREGEGRSYAAIAQRVGLSKALTVLRAMAVNHLLAGMTLTGAVERVTFHSEETGFCVLRVKVRGHRDLVTVVGTAATITPGEYIEGQGVWVNDRTHGL